MAIRELRKVRKADNSKYQYIWRLVQQGKIKKYVTEGGYLAYDTEEFKTFKKTVKQGRPLKGE